MPTTQQLNITLPIDIAQQVEELVAHGGYASESEVICEGLRALQERDAAIEQWLRDDVAPSYHAHKTAPELASPLAEVAARLDAFMDAKERTKA